MPELPEVETIKRRLQQVLPTRRITGVEVLDQRSWQADVNPTDLQTATITGIERRAKILIINLDQDRQLLIHLKMTGQLIWQDGPTRLGGGHPTVDWVSELPSSHTRVIFQLDNSANLFFNDQRLFGWIRFGHAHQLEKHFINYGPDIIDQRITVEYLLPILSRRTTPIKQVIMDNAVLAGVGNIYACDALNLARINPRRPAKSLTVTEVTTLLHAMLQVINRGIELGGTTTDGKFVDIHGFAGGYQHELRVYNRTGLPCLTCGTTIIKDRLGGRGTYYCPGCQH